MGSHLKLQQKCLKEPLSVISSDPPNNLDLINNVEIFDVFLGSTVSDSNNSYMFFCRKNAQATFIGKPQLKINSLKKQ